MPPPRSLAHVHQPLRGGQTYVHLRVRGLKAWQARHQPAQREGRHQAHGQRSAAGRLAHALDRLGDAVEAVAQARQQRLPIVGQQQRAREPTEQLHAQDGLERFDLVADRYGFTPAMRSAGWEEFRQMEVRTPPQAYPDLGLVPSIPLRRYLVTSGFRRLQNSKIDALGIRSWFEEVIIDALDDKDDENAPPHGKRPVFERILAREGCTPQQVLVIGDNPLSELGAGRALGAVTVQTVRPGISPWELADYRVESLEEVLQILAADQAPAGAATGLASVSDGCA